MWRYLVGGIAALLLVAAGWLVFGSRAAVDPLVPPLPVASDARPETADPLPARVPEATPRTREQKRFDRYDKDRDTRITREEYLASRRKAFARLDANGDGRLSFDEWAAKTIAKFANADRDRSATLSATEFATTVVKRRAAPRCACPPPQAGTDDAD